MFKIFLSVAIVLGSASAFAWGAKGHQIVSYVGASLAEDGQVFWGANLTSMRKLSTVPDRVWKKPDYKSEEAYQHFFQIDAYYDSANYNHIIDFPNSYANAVSEYGERVIVKNGTAPWRVRQLYNIALMEFKTGDMKSALEHVGAMSHYIADISQPLHVTENFNGQYSGNSGIHSYFETTVIKDENAVREEVKKRAKILLKDKNFLNYFKSRPLMDVLLLEIERSITYKDLILKIDDEYGRNAQGEAAQLDLAIDRMADGAATLALVMSQLWKETRLTPIATPMAIDDPEWVVPNFSDLRALKAGKQSTREPDCF